MVKLNLEKADDNIIWEFLKYAMPKEGFSPWRKWVVGWI